MGPAAHSIIVDEAFERIEEAILPSISLMLDTLLDAAALNRPGMDAEVYATELRTIALQLETFTREVETYSSLQLRDQGYRPASVA